MPPIILLLLLLCMILFLSLFLLFLPPFPLSSPFSRSPPPAALSHFPHSRCAAVRGTDDSKIWENCVTH